MSITYGHINEDLIAEISDWNKSDSYTAETIYGHAIRNLRMPASPLGIYTCVSMTYWPSCVIIRASFLPSGLVMLQTTNNIFNKTLYDTVTPDALLAWHRVRLANWLASGGGEWASYISQYNSG